MNCASDFLEEAKDCFEVIQDNKAAKPLLQHILGMESIIRTSGQRCIESPRDQCYTWRRLLVHDMAKGADVSHFLERNGNIAKCILCCNLSGSLACYKSNKSFGLARVMSTASQPQSFHISRGVDEVLKRAKELNASVIMFFCLPFQYGIERAYWEMRTIRITKTGDLKDGELCFGKSDLNARVCPCTASVETWKTTDLDALLSAFHKEVSALCIDRSEECALELSNDQMRHMLDMLKNDRKKIIEDHRRELEQIQYKHLQEVQSLELKVEESERDADKRVSNVTTAAQATKRSQELKQADVERQLNMALRDVVSARKLVDEVKQRLDASEKEKQRERKQSMSRHDAMEAQIKTLSSQSVKSENDASVALHELEQQKKEFEALTKTANLLRDQCEASKDALQEGIQEAAKQVEKRKLNSAVIKGLLMLVSSRLDNTKSDLKDANSKIKALEAKAVSKEDDCNKKDKEIQKYKSEVEETKKKVDEMRLKIESQSSNMQTKALHQNHASNNGALYCHPNFHGNPYSGYAPVFPNHTYRADPFLESSISQLHSALNSITSIARASAHNGKSAEVNQSKLDALNFALGSYQPM